MVGLTQDRASPHVAILCKERWFCRQARHIILESRFLQDKGWVGCIKLSCEIRQNGANAPQAALKSTLDVPGSKKSTSSQRIQHNVAISFAESTKNPCGLRIAISGVNGYVRLATLGGIVEINGELLGLSVSHAFSAETPSYDDTRSEDVNCAESLVLDEDDLDPFVRPAGFGELPVAREQYSDILGASESSNEPTRTSEAEDISPSVDSESDSDRETVDPFMGQRLDGELAKWYVLLRNGFGGDYMSGETAPRNTLDRVSYPEYFHIALC